MDEISRAKLTRLLESRMAYGDAQSADGLVDSALASLDALMKYGVHLVLALLDANLDPEMNAILSDAHPGNRPVKEYPKWAYHDDAPAILLDSEDDIADLPPGYHDATGNELSPAAPVEAAEPAEPEQPLVPAPIPPIDVPAVEEAAPLPPFVAPSPEHSA